MTNEQQEKLKSIAEQQQMKGSATIGGSMLGQNLCKEPGLRERISSMKYRAEAESSNVDKLRELEYLLDKNPEVARILELMSQVHVL